PALRPREVLGDAQIDRNDARRIDRHEERQEAFDVGAHGGRDGGFPQSISRGEDPISPLPSDSASSRRRPSPPLPLLSPGERRDKKETRELCCCFSPLS